MMIHATELQRPRLTLHGPAVYRIHILGPLETDEPEHLDGLIISKENRSGGPEVTRLYGEFADQAALLQVLNHLLGLEVTLLSVEYLASE